MSTKITHSDPRDIAIGGYKLTATALSGEGSYEEWALVGAFIQRAESGVQWWIGDWLAQGDSFGDRAEQAQSLFSLEYQTLANYRNVAEAIPPERRRPELSWSHHRVIHKLDEEKQDELLDWCLPDGADKHSKSVRELKERTKGEPLASSLPESRYDVIYVHPTDFVEAKKLKVAGIAAMDCALFIHTPDEGLYDAMDCIRVWGASYLGVCISLWSAQEEFILLAIWGNGVRPTKMLPIRTKQYTEMLIEEMHPNAKRVQIGGDEREGWETWPK